MSKELLPCPFCGSKNVVLIQAGNDYTKKRSVTIKCKECFVKRTTGAIKFDLAWCESKAIELWNKRLPSHNKDYSKCRDCGTPINKGEAETFGICDECWDKHFA